MNSKSIYRDGLERPPLKLGGLYNACKDEILPGFLFEVKKQKQEPAKSADLQYYFEDETIDKLKKLDVDAELSVSLMCGLIKLSGKGSYFSNEEAKQRTVKVTLCYRWKTLFETFNHLDPNSADVFLSAATEGFATHFVQGIQYGGTVCITFESQVCEHSEMVQIKGSLRASLEKLKLNSNGKASWNFDDKDTKLLSSFRVHIKGTLKQVSLSTDPSEIIQFINKIPSQLETINNGKGVPLGYTLYPLSALEKCQGMKIARLLGTIDELVLSEASKYLMVFEKLKKELLILQALGDSIRDFFPPSILKEIELSLNNLCAKQSAFMKATQDGILQWRAENNSKSLMKVIDDLVNSKCLFLLKSLILDLRDKHEQNFYNLNVIQSKYNTTLLPYNKKVKDFSRQTQTNVIFVHYCSSTSSINNDSLVYFLKKQKTLQTQFDNPTFLLVDIETNRFHKITPRGFERWENHKFQSLIGISVENDGSHYDGEWKDNKKNGQGRFVWTNGDTYDGDWKDNIRTGKGKFVWANGDTYDGDWKNDMLNGKGKLVFTSGNTYDGDWKDNMRYGKGKCVWANGDTYDGDWKDNIRYGKGKCVWANGNIYDGDWKDDMRYGKGKCVWPNGDTYYGDWKDDMRYGKGKLVFANGNTYEGEWRGNNQIG